MTIANTPSRITRACCFLILLGLCLPSLAQAPATGAAAKEETKQSPAPIDVVVPFAPTAFQVDGKTLIAYELHITNFFEQNTILTRVEAFDSSGTALAHLEQADLPPNVILIGNEQASGVDKLTIGPGQRIVVYLWFSLEGVRDIHEGLVHRITVKVGKKQREFSTQCARSAIRRDLVTIGPPLRGDNWVAANSPANDSIHRRSLIPVDGRAQISQRYAIDWVRNNSDGKTFLGDEKDNKSYRAYGSEVLAVADGAVAEVKDGIPENIPGTDSRAVPITLETIGGNHVVIGIGNGRFAFYAHLQPGSIKVKPGDRVKRGQVLGLLGNSGNSTEPHLHFHLADNISLLGSEGIPYALESFDAKPKKDTAATHHQMEIPTQDEIVMFSEK
ncbi:MAG: M23 family metallopeptidase [Candidatus Angelobacter sp.]